MVSLTISMMTLSQVMLWDEQLNQEMAKLMLAEGVLVIPLRFFTNEDGCNRVSEKRATFSIEAGKQPTEQLNQKSEYTQNYCMLI